MFKKASYGLIGAVIVGALVAPATAATSVQTINATLGSSVSITTAPSDVTGWVLAPNSANTTSGGSLGIDANGAYTVTLQADRAAMGEHDGTGYVSGGKSLTTPMTLTPTRTGGTAAVPGVPTAQVAGTGALGIVAGLGGGTDVFSLQLSQPTVPADSALSGSNTYRIQLTYTASAAI